MSEQDLMWDAIGDAADNAENFAERSYFGKCIVTVARYVHWIDGTPSDVTVQEYNKLPYNEKMIELLFAVDIQELKDSLEFTYERKVNVGRDDWNKIIAPSLRKILGKDAVSKGNYIAALKSVNGFYVHVKDIPQVKNPEYNTLRFEQIFTSKEECVAAANALFSGGNDTPASSTSMPEATKTVANTNVPDGWESDVWEALVEEEFKPALAGGETVAELAERYGVKVQFIAMIKR